MRVPIWASVGLPIGASVVVYIGASVWVPIIASGGKPIWATVGVPIGASVGVGVGTSVRASTPICWTTHWGGHPGDRCLPRKQEGNSSSSAFLQQIKYDFFL